MVSFGLTNISLSLAVWVDLMYASAVTSRLRDETKPGAEIVMIALLMKNVFFEKRWNCYKPSFHRTDWVTKLSYQFGGTSFF